MPDEFSFLETPKLPRTRCCPTCDGAGMVDHPKLAEAIRLIKQTLEPVASSLKALRESELAPGISHYDSIVETGIREARRRMPDQVCRHCKGKGHIPMEGAAY